MNKFSSNYENVMFTGRFADVSEPLKEYTVDDEGRLTEVSTSCTLLGVKSKSNGRWGWVDTAGTYIIPAEYDSGWILCYNGVVILEKMANMAGYTGIALELLLDLNMITLAIVLEMYFVSIKAIV